MLGAAHTAPSVGQSQPWRFVVIREAAARERAAGMADRERLRQAGLLETEASRQLLDLKLEGLREAPVGVVVCCDRRAPAAGVLGRATYTDADLWSCCCAVENLWLAARVEGLGLGWVTLFQPSDLADLLGLPEGVEALGWLCLGWPDERPPFPGLERAGWSQRQPLDEVVLYERWPAADEAPKAPRSRLRAPESSEVVGVRDESDDLLTIPGSLGVLDLAVDRLLALRHPNTEGGCLVLVGADHPVTALGVSTYPSSVTRDVIMAAVAGEAFGVVAAHSAGMEVVVVDAGVSGGPVVGAEQARPAGPRGDLVAGDAMTTSDTSRLLGLGRSLGRRAARHGIVALGEVGVGNTTVAASLAAAQLGLSALDATGLGAGGDSDTLARKIAVVESALARARSTHGAALDDPIRALGALGGPEIVVLVGVVLGAAESGALVVLDGLATGLAGLSASMIEPALISHLVAGQRSRERAHAAVLAHLGLEPLLDLRIRSGEGAGACLATGLLRAATRVRTETGQRGGSGRR